MTGSEVSSSAGSLRDRTPGQALGRLFSASGTDEKRVPVMLPYPFPGPFDYLVPPDLEVAPGDVVLVPLNRRETIGVVWDPSAQVDAPPLPAHKLKPIAARLDTSSVRPALRRFIDWVAGYTLSPPGEVMAMALRAVRSDPVPTRMGWRRPEL